MSETHDIDELDYLSSNQLKILLRELDSRFYSLTSSLPVLFHAMDEHGRIIFWNKQCEIVSGYPASEIIGNPNSFELLYTDPIIRKELLQRLRTYSSDSDGVAEVMTTRDGGKKVVLWFNLGKACTVPGWAHIGVGIDVTERIRAENDFRMLFNRMLDSFALYEIVLDENGTPVDYRFISVNPAFESISGLKAGKIIGRTLCELFQTASLKWIDVYGKVAVTGIPSRFEIKSDIQDRWFQVVAFQPQPGQLACISQDITARKKTAENEAALRETELMRRALEREQELNAMKTRFVSLVSHEFRTPLTVIKNSQQMLEAYDDRLPQERRKKYLDSIDRSVRTMTLLLDNVMLMNRAESDRLPFQPHLAQLDALCRSMLDLTNDMHPNRIIRLNLSDGADGIFLLDEHLVNHILSNLLSNAVKYSPQETEVVLSVGVRNYEKRTIEIIVRDQGIGIPRNEMERVFEPFVRGSNSGTKTGTGLGLSIVKHSVERHGGKLTVESEEGKGSTFTVHIPAVAEERKASDYTDEQSAK
ncbi:MAG: PAS domain-containing sensor histidine kinase [Candidatus Riflebacteria bacterium]|nr:PAS domain-containing sensor histidine kinase [Candidatus Riflebacteria bacterium]